MPETRCGHDAAVAFSWGLCLGRGLLKFGLEVIGIVTKHDKTIPLFSLRPVCFLHSTLLKMVHHLWVDDYQST